MGKYITVPFSSQSVHAKMKLPKTHWIRGRQVVFLKI